MLSAEMNMMKATIKMCINKSTPIDESASPSSSSSLGSQCAVHKPTHPPIQAGG